MYYKSILNKYNTQKLSIHVPVSSSTLNNLTIIRLVRSHDETISNMHWDDLKTILTILKEKVR